MSIDNDKDDSTSIKNAESTVTLISPIIRNINLVSTEMQKNILYQDIENKCVNRREVNDLMEHIVRHCNEIKELNKLGNVEFKIKSIRAILITHRFPGLVNTLCSDNILKAKEYINTFMHQRYDLGKSIDMIMGALKVIKNNAHERYI